MLCSDHKIINNFVLPNENSCEFLLKITEVTRKYCEQLYVNA